MKQPTNIADMLDPVRCLCGEIYDLTCVTVIASYADATVFKAPCCGRTSDDRAWKSLPDYTRVTNTDTWPFIGMDGVTRG